MNDERPWRTATSIRLQLVWKVEGEMRARSLTRRLVTRLLAHLQEELMACEQAGLVDHECESSAIDAHELDG
ncbi:MAG TPA: hypothetical protein VFA07_07890 [Chthonomonadaceae bacterium]|nr:hypothetical protein [Chthonomonadaceae bacterium]